MQNICCSSLWYGACLIIRFMKISVEPFAPNLACCISKIYIYICYIQCDYTQRKGHLTQYYYTKCQLLALFPLFLNTNANIKLAAAVITYGSLNKRLTNISIGIVIEVIKKLLYIYVHEHIHYLAYSHILRAASIAPSEAPI